MIPLITLGKQNRQTNSQLLLLIAEINVLQAINNVLKERHEIESNYKNLALKFHDMQQEEAHRRAKVCRVVSVCSVGIDSY